MSQQIKDLIGQLIKIAKSRDLSQSQLADRVGITAVGLSKAKSRGDIRASTLAELAAQLDLELALVPRRSKETAIQAIRAGAFFQTSSQSSVEKEE